MAARSDGRTEERSHVPQKGDIPRVGKILETGVKTSKDFANYSAKARRHK